MLEDKGAGPAVGADRPPGKTKQASPEAPWLAVPSKRVRKDTRYIVTIIRTECQREACRRLDGGMFSKLAVEASLVR